VTQEAQVPVPVTFPCYPLFFIGGPSLGRGSERLGAQRSYRASAKLLILLASRLYPTSEQLVVLSLV
jgi:hypothetical protein